MNQSARTALNEIIGTTSTPNTFEYVYNAINGGQSVSDSIVKRVLARYLVWYDQYHNSDHFDVVESARLCGDMCSQGIEATTEGMWTSRFVSAYSVAKSL